MRVRETLTGARGTKRVGQQISAAKKQRAVFGGKGGVARSRRLTDTRVVVGPRFESLAQQTAFEILRPELAASKKYARLERVKSFADRIRDGEVFDLKTAASLTGYSTQHLGRLCRAKTVSHVRRNKTQYYFTAQDLQNLFEHVRTIKTSAR